MPKIVIATPALHESASIQYAHSILQAGLALAARGAQMDLIWLAVSDIVMARNMLVVRALADQEMTHLLFIDSDMSFAPGIVERMFGFDRDFVSTIYPKRDLDIGQLLSDGKPGEAPGVVLSRNLRYNINFLEQDGGKYIDMTDGITKVGGTGMGLCLIKRRVFETMIEKGVAKEYRGNHPLRHSGLPYYGFFDKFPTGDDVPPTEDFCFCRRWTDRCGGEIWAIIDAEIGHHGLFRYGGTYVDKLKAGRV